MNEGNVREMFDKLFHSMDIDDLVDPEMKDIMNNYKVTITDEPVTKKQIAKMLLVLAMNLEQYSHNTKMTENIIDHNFDVIKKKISLIPKTKIEFRNTVLTLSISGIASISLGTLLFTWISRLIWPV